MIITRCPYRVSFFGGGTDFPYWYEHNGSNIISTSINAFCYVTVRKLLPYYGNKYRVSWSKIEEVNDPKLIKHPAVKGALEFLNIKNGLEIHTDGDLPARSGLGSSSAFSSSLLLALSALKKEETSLKTLTEKTIYFEQEILKENVGIQDQIQTCNGGFNLLSINKKGDYRILRVESSSELVREISRNMLLLFTGIERNSSNIQNELQSFDTELRDRKLRNIANIANIVRDRIINEDLSFDEFTSFLEQSWYNKLNLFPNSLIKEKIEKIYIQAKKAGALSGKLLGAGGGGFFIFFVKEKDQSKFISEMRNYTVVKHNVTDSQCKVIFNSYNIN